MIIAARFNGPPASGNGGYSAGLFASALSDSDVDGSGAVEVTLRRPPPLDTELSVRGLALYQDDQLIAEAAPSELADADEVPAVSLDEARDASAGYIGFREHPFPSCYVCGPLREPGDGLRLFPGRLSDGRTAAPFVVPADVSPALVWAALDCPSGWATSIEVRPSVLGRIAVRLAELPEPGAECVVVGRLTGVDGRKAYAGSTLYSPAGYPLATARTTWITVAS
jgi:hypothetical protein